MSEQTVPLGTVAYINPTVGALELEADEFVDFVPMAAVEVNQSVSASHESRPYGEVKKGYTSFVDGDILLAKITPCFENGKISQIRVNSDVGFGSTEFHVVRPRTDMLDGRYLVHLLRQEKIRTEGERRMTGSAGQRRVPKSFLESLPIFLPPLTEQRRIAAILDKADALRAKRREALTQLDRLAQAIFVEMFGDPVVNRGGWTKRALKELGKVTTGGTPPSSMEGMFGGPIPFITPGDLESNQRPKRWVTDAGAREAGTVRAGATLVCCIGATIGKMGMASVRSAFNQQLNAVEWESGLVDDEFGLAALRFLKPSIVSAGASTTLPILKKSSFEKLAIPVPPLDLQSKFASRIRRISDLEAQQSLALSAVDSLFASVQQRAFSGEL